MNTEKYIDCPECDGSGEQMIAELWPTGHAEVWHDCKFCEGEGKFEESDYLIMRLSASKNYL